ncbi:MAG: hypothetical protein ACT443_11455 [Gemmatimonadota bacterium]
MEPIQKGSAVRARRSGEIAGHKRVRETHDVRRDQIRVQTQRIGSKDDVLTELRSQAVKELTERVASVFRTCVRPEIRQNLVARDAAFARGREQSQ